MARVNEGGDSKAGANLWSGKGAALRMAKCYRPSAICLPVIEFQSARETRARRFTEQQPAPTGTVSARRAPVEKARSQWLTRTYGVDSAKDFAWHKGRSSGP
jgi:hypothetical protein